MANFTNNTTQLQNLLAKVNELPEAGSGSGGPVEMCTVTMVDIAHGSANWWIRYIGADGSPLILEYNHTYPDPDEFIINVCPNSFLFTSGDILEIDGEARIVENSNMGMYGLAYISGDATVSFYAS